MWCWKFECLRNVNVEHSDFISVCSHANNGDFVYLDPPYYYNAEDGHATYNTDRVETERLIIHDVRNAMDDMSRRGVKVARSMSDYPYVRRLFADYTIHEVEIRRNLRRGVVVVTELVITNY